MNYENGFVKHLLKNGYPETAIHIGTYKYDGKTYDRVEVFSDGHIIQAFVLMSEEHCAKLPKFPFYRTYRQWNDYGYLTPPACNVAVYNNKKEEWEIHSANDLKLEKTSPNFLNYDEGVKRFNNRWDYSGNRKFQRLTRRLSITGLILLSVYLVAYLLSVNGLLAGIEIPMNASVVTMLVVVALLLFIPRLMPYIKSISVNGFGLEINQEF